MSIAANPFLTIMMTVASTRAADPGLTALWDMVELRKTPLAPELLSTRKAPLFVKGVNDWMHTGDSWVASAAKHPEPSGTRPRGDEQLIVTSYRFSSGPNRVFCALAKPENASGGVPVVLVFHGGGGHGSGALAVATARKNAGMAALSVDYNGQFRPATGPVTQWETVTEGLRAPRLQLAADRRDSPMYHYVMAARRAMDFLEELDEFDMSRVGCFGISYGGWVSLILAGVDRRVKCVVTGVSAGGTEGTAARSSQPLRWQPADQRGLWLRTYDPIAYAPHTRAGVLLKICANDRFFWLSGAVRNYEALAGPKRLLITPNSDHGCGGPPLPDPSAAWTRHILFGDEALPEVVPDGLRFDGGTCSWRVRGPHPIKRAVLNWSPGNVVSCARYWLAIAARQDGGRWTADLPPGHVELMGKAYATVFDSGGRAASSVPVMRDGLDPQQASGPLWPDGCLWDSERGAEAWRPLKPGGKPGTRIATNPKGGVDLAPEAGSRGFCALTNSVVLASAHASRHAGIRLHVNGNGMGGELRVALLRDPTSLDEVESAAVRQYGPDGSVLDLRWGDFQAKRRGATPKLWPFNGLMLEGDRAAAIPLTVQRVGFLN